MLEQYLYEGFKEDVQVRYALTKKTSRSEGKLVLVLGQSIYHSGKFSTRSKGLTEIQDRGVLSLNPGDASSLGVEEGTSVRLSNGNGEAIVSVKLVDRVPPGVAWFPEHFDQELRPLFSITVDERNLVPCWKIADVKVAKVN